MPKLLPKMLTPAQIAQYHEQGFLSPIRVMPSTGRQTIVNSRMIVFDPMAMRPWKSRGRSSQRSRLCSASPPMTTCGPMWVLSPTSQSERTQ